MYPPLPCLVCPPGKSLRHSLQTSCKCTIAHPISNLTCIIKSKCFNYLIQLNAYHNIVVRHNCPKFCANLFNELHLQFIRPSVTDFQVFITIIPKERFKGVMYPACVWCHGNGGKTERKNKGRISDNNSCYPQFILLLM